MEQNNTQITEEKMGFFEKMYKSLYDMKTYAYVLKKSAGSAVVYTLLITLIFGCITLVANLYRYNKVYGAIVESVQKMPDFEFKDETLTVEGDQPIKYIAGTTAVIIDTTGTLDESVLNDYQQGFFIGADKMVEKQLTSTQTFEYSQFQGLTFDKPDLVKLIGTLKNMAIPFIIFGSLVGWFLGKLLFALVLAVIVGLIANSVTNARLSFGDLYKLSLYATTGSVILGTIFDYLKIVTSAVSGISSILYFILAAVYLAMAISYIGRNRIMPENPYGPGYPYGNGYNNNWNNNPQNFYGQQNPDNQQPVNNPQNYGQYAPIPQDQNNQQNANNEADANSIENPGDENK